MKKLKLLLKPTVLAMAIALFGTIGFVQNSQAQDLIEWGAIGAETPLASGDVEGYYGSSGVSGAEYFDSFFIESNDEQEVILRSTNDACLSDRLTTATPKLTLDEGSTCSNSMDEAEGIIVLDNACGDDKDIVVYFRTDYTTDSLSSGLDMPVTLSPNGNFLDETTELHFEDTLADTCEPPVYATECCKKKQKCCKTNGGWLNNGIQPSELSQLN